METVHDHLRCAGQKADIVIYFNRPVWLCYWHILKRYFFKDAQIDDRAAQCKETIRWSLITYTWSFKDRVKQSIENLQAQYPQTPLYEINTDQDLQQVLNSIFGK